MPTENSIMLCYIFFAVIAAQKGQWLPNCRHPHAGFQKTCSLKNRTFILLFLYKPRRNLACDCYSKLQRHKWQITGRDQLYRSERKGRKGRYEIYQDKRRGYFFSLDMNSASNSNFNALYRYLSNFTVSTPEDYLIDRVNLNKGRLPSLLNQQLIIIFTLVDTVWKLKFIILLVQGNFFNKLYFYFREKNLPIANTF